MQPPPPFISPHGHSLRVMLNVTATKMKKAKDWSGLGKICKRHPVETPKVHPLRLLHGKGSMYDKVALAVVSSSSGWQLMGTTMIATVMEGLGTA